MVSGVGAAGSAVVAPLGWLDVAAEVAVAVPLRLGDAAAAAAEGSTAADGFAGGGGEPHAAANSTSQAELRAVMFIGGGASYQLRRRHSAQPSDSSFATVGPLPGRACNDFCNQRQAAGWSSAFSSMAAML